LNLLPVGAATAPVPHLWHRVSALGVAQIVSWGTLFYTIAVLGAAMRADTGVSELWLFGSFTAGLFLSGIVSPWLGRQIDTRGGRRVLMSGSLLGAMACVTLALAQGPLTVLLGWLLAGVAMAAALYDPAFATLHQMARGDYRRSVTALTLFGGFASTVFWPLSQYLLETIGWRACFGIYAGLHVVLCLPIHALSVPPGLGAPTVDAPTAAPLPEGALKPQRRAVFAWLAAALALLAFISSAIAAHLITLLSATGLATRDAVLIGALIGPMQVAGRVIEFAFTRHVRARTVGTLAFGLMAVSLAIFTQVKGVWILALAFVIPYGWANGVVTIVRGTVPAELLGARNYGAMLGKLALPQFILKALAPFALTLLFVVDPARGVAPYALFAIAILAFVAYRAAVTTANRH